MRLSCPNPATRTGEKAENIFNREIGTTKKNTDLKKGYQKTSWNRINVQVILLCHFVCAEGDSTWRNSDYSLLSVESVQNANTKQQDVLETVVERCVLIRFEGERAYSLFFNKSLCSSPSQIGICATKLKQLEHIDRTTAQKNKERSRNEIPENFESLKH